MKIKIYIIILILFVSVSVLIYNLNNTSNEDTRQPKNTSKELIKKPQQDTIKIIKSTPEIQLYYYIKQYCKKYNVPEEIVYSIAHNETNYRGPLDKSYKHNLKSSAGARGALQVMPSTYRAIMGQKISEHELQNNIQKNTECAIKYLSILYKKYKNWDKVLAVYASGNPKNTHLDYIKKTKYKSKNHKKQFVKL